jgi:hypothetical protein
MVKIYSQVMVGEKVYQWLQISHAYMVKDKACKKTGGVSDVVVLVVPHITQKFDGKGHLLPLLPI